MRVCILLYVCRCIVQCRAKSSRQGTACVGRRVFVFECICDYYFFYSKRGEEVHARTETAVRTGVRGAHRQMRRHAWFRVAVGLCLDLDAGFKMFSFCNIGGQCGMPKL